MWNEPTSGAVVMLMDTIRPEHRDFLTGQRWGVLATLRRDGRPQLSNVGYTYDPATDRVRVSVTATRAKTRNAARDPRVALHVTSADFRSYVVADGEASLGPVATEPDDVAVEQLIDLYRTLAGEHPDWDDFRAAMVREQRQVLTIAVQHTYGKVPS